jgi:Fe-S cluster assembly ATP-binding protein
MLELKGIGLTTDSGLNILKDVSLKLDEKKIYAVTGPNGSGKSTLANVIMGIVKPTSGRLLLDGEDITDKDITERARLGIGYAFQNPPRFKGIKVKDMLALAAPEKRGAACDILYNVGLCSHDYIGRDMDATLSGGEIKRIEIATVLARNLKAAVFDEPEAGIDLWSFQKLAETFMDMHEKTNTTIVIISHQERILSLADEIILINKGEVRQNVPKDAILKKGSGDLCMCRPNCERTDYADAECAR